MTPIESALARLEAARNTLAAAVEVHQWALFRQDKGVGNPHECSVASLASQDAQAEYNALLRNAAPALLAVARAAVGLPLPSQENIEDTMMRPETGYPIILTAGQMLAIHNALSALAAAVGEEGTW